MYVGAVSEEEMENSYVLLMVPSGVTTDNQLSHSTVSSASSSHTPPHFMFYLTVVFLAGSSNLSTLLDLH